MFPFISQYSPRFISAPLYPFPIQNTRNGGNSILKVILFN